MGARGGGGRGGDGGGRGGGDGGDVGDCVGGIKFISPAQFEANIDMHNKDDNRLKPRGQSNPHMRVANLVVYASDAERDEVCLCLGR